MESVRPISELCEMIGEVDGMRVRPWQESDADVLAAAWSDPEIARWNPVPTDRSIGYAKSWIASTQTQTSTNRTVDVVLTRSEEPAQVLGEVGLQIDRRQRLAEIGFWVAAPSRGHGHAERLLEFGLSLAELLSLRGAVAMVDPSNQPAQSTLRSAGWTEIPATGSRLAFAARPRD